MNSMSKIQSTQRSRQSETKRDREKDRDSEFRSCVKVEVAVLGFPS